MNTQKGFAPALLILLGLIVIGGGVYFYTNSYKKTEDANFENKTEATSQEEKNRQNQRVLNEDQAEGALKEVLPKIHGTDITLKTKVGEKLGELTLTEIGNCSAPFENDVCGIITTGTVEVEGVFFYNSHFGEHCFKLDLLNETNKNSIVNPAQNINNEKYGFCFNEDMTKILPSKYLVEDDESFSDLVKIRIKDIRFDWRPMGVTDTATFVGIVD
jgi:hypothetical protein